MIKNTIFGTLFFANFILELDFTTFILLNDLQSINKGYTIMKQEKKLSSKNNEVFSTVDLLVLATTIILCLGLEISAVSPTVQDKIYKKNYTRLIEQGYPDDIAQINAKTQAQDSQKSLYFFGLGAGLIGIGALRIKKSAELNREFKRIKSEYSR